MCESLKKLIALTDFDINPDTISDDARKALAKVARQWRLKRLTNGEAAQQASYIIFEQVCQTGDPERDRAVLNIMGLKAIDVGWEPMAHRQPA